MKYLITGSTGYIGKALIENLREEKRNIIRVIDLRDDREGGIRAQIGDFKPDFIYHLAVYGLQSRDQDLRIMVKANVQKTAELLEATKHLKYKALINIGSAFEYNILGYYDATKQTQTHLCRIFGEKNNKNTITARLFYVYGPHQPPHKFIPGVINNLKEGKTMPIIHSAKNDWIFIDDVISALRHIESHYNEMKGKVLDVGTGKMITNKKILSILEELSGRKLKTTEYKAFVRRINRAANTAEMKAIGWSPEWTMKEGLVLTYFSMIYDKNNYSNAV